MFKQKIKHEERDLIKRLKAIENSPPDDFRKLFEASHLLKDEFISGVMLLPVNEQNALLKGMLEDTLLHKVMADELTDWQNKDRVGKSGILKVVYEILECVSNSTVKEISDSPSCQKERIGSQTRERVNRAAKDQRHIMGIQRKRNTSHSLRYFVKWFNNVKGYGFVVDEKGRDVFIHTSNGNVPSCLKNGQIVEIEILGKESEAELINIRPVKQK